MSGSGTKKVVEAAAKAGKSIDWDGMAKLLVSEEARKEFANLRRAFDEVNQALQTKFSQEPQPIDWEHYRKGIGSRLVDMYKEAYESVDSWILMGPLVLAVDARSPAVSSDAYSSKLHHPVAKLLKPFASVTMEEEKPFNFLRVFCEGIIAGGTAGVVVETVLYPIDTIKTRLQAAHGGSKINWKGLYSGLAGNLAGVLPASAVFVGIYEPAKRKLLEIFPENLSAFAHLTAGAIGGVAASLIRVPTEVVKQRMQTGQFASAPNAVRLIIAKEGFRGLYAGYSSFLLRDLPFDAMQFCIYEQLRIGYKIAARRELNDPENAVIGAFAGAITGAITTPLDVMKTRLMVQGSANQYNGLLNCAQTIIREEGPAAFLKGIGPRVLWIGIGGSIFFGVLERTKQLASQQLSARDTKSDPSKQQ